MTIVIVVEGLRSVVSVEEERGGTLRSFAVRVHGRSILEEEQLCCRGGPVASPPETLFLIPLLAEILYR
jgi:hypothetical protein